MSAIARYLLDMSRDVSGSDLRAAGAGDLARRGARIFSEHRAENVQDADWIVASDAVASDNIELQTAIARGIHVLRRAECLHLLAGDKKCVYVAGAHGKTTTTAMLAHVLEAAGAAPSYVLGGIADSLAGAHAAHSSGRHFVAEACEAFRSLDCVEPEFGIVTNIDDEHLDHYGSQQQLDAAFRRFAAAAAARSGVAVNGDDEGVRRVVRDIDGHIRRFGFAADNDIQARRIEFDEHATCFEICVDGAPRGRIEIGIPGMHAAANALACVAMASMLGLEFDAIAKGLRTFSGVRRRWQRYGVQRGVTIVDDYAHHPRELEQAVLTARSVAGPNRRLIVAFQPQLYSRTERLHKEFAASLFRADRTFLLEVDPGGERDRNGGHSALIAAELARAGLRCDLFDDIDDLIERGSVLLEPDDFLLLAGAGDIAGAARRVTRRLSTPAYADFARAASSHATKRRPAWHVIHEVMRRFAARAPNTADASTVVARLRCKARSNPTQPAVQQGVRSLTFSELDRRSLRCAGGLIALGVGKGDVVGVNLLSSIDLIVVVVALARLGAIYLPLDDRLPRERIRYQCAKASAALLVTRRGSAIDADDTPANKVCVEDLDAPVTRAEMSRIDAACADDVAYICFTSGSTGYPKGVQIRHGALSALVGDIVDRFAIGARTRLAANTAIGFDVSIAEIWMTLCGGGCLCTSGAQKPLAAGALADFIDANLLTHLAATPSVLATLPERSFASLQCIVAAGEACPSSLVDRLAPRRDFFNAYGPTEATIYATVARCNPGQTVTIGKPLSHMATCVLDQDLNPVAEGDVGELCLSGIGIADGYLDDVDETTRKFVRLELPDSATVNIYRTADLVRRTRSGDLVYLGRTDDQVKIRGQRLELAEIEQSARRVAGVQDAVVCVDQRGATAELICFFVAARGGESIRSTLLAQLIAWLPTYMIPAHFVEVETIPTTPSGKKSRAALLAKHRNKIARHVEWAAPRSDEERLVASAWKKALALERDVGMYDDFESLGGDSLSSLAIIGELERQLSVRLPPGYFGRFSTITKMAAQLTDLPREDGRYATRAHTDSRIYRNMRDLTAGWPGSRIREGSLVVSVGSEDPVHHFFCCLQNEQELLALARYLGSDFRVHGMRSGHLVMDYTPENISFLAEAYVEEIVQIAPGGSVLLGGICQGCLITHAMANKLHEAGRNIPLMIMMEQGKPLPYAGNIQYLYGEDSYLNPANRFAGGLDLFRQMHGERCRVDIIPGEHGRMFFEPNVQHFVTKVMSAMREWVRS